MVTNKINSVPDGYHAITPYLVIRGAGQAIDYYKQAFGATEVMRIRQPDGRVGHAELKFGDAVVMLADEFPEINVVGPATLGNTTVGVLLYVENADATFDKAVSLGAKVRKPMADQIYGDRNGTLEDPFGHRWTVATHKEDVTPDEMKQRMAAVSRK
jgi:PhnB protein